MATPQVIYCSEAHPPQHGYCVGIARQAPQATVTEGLAQGPCVAARSGIEPTTLRTKSVDSTKAPHTPQTCSMLCVTRYAAV